jgi:methylglyoxal/glyoxal reductase
MNTSKRLNAGNAIPTIGLGTWQLADGSETVRAVRAALKVGYRLVDTAKIYGNEESVGRAIRDSSVSREDLFVTTKLWNSDQGYESALKAFAGSLERLDLEYIDLYLVHWPGDDIHRRSESWQALTDIHGTGKVRAMGVSNYSISQLTEVLKTSIPPAVNQIELHPFNYASQKQLLEFCEQQGIVVMAYSPLAQARRLQDPTIQNIADQVGKTSAQVMLRWSLQHGAVPIPRSSHPKRIEENFRVFDFELSPEHMKTLDNLSDGSSVMHRRNIAGWYLKDRLRRGLKRLS